MILFDAIPMLSFFASEVVTEFRRSFGGETSCKGCEQAESRAWKLFGLVPLMLLHDLEAQVHLAETSLQDVLICSPKEDGWSSPNVLGSA